jgi:ketosteroid isomerase-like protein
MRDENMKRVGVVLAAIAASGLVISAGPNHDGIRAAARVEGGRQERARVDDEFEAMLDRADAAQLELQNGRAEAYKALWSHSADVTLSGGFGGTVEKGWEQVNRRLDWVATQFSKATHENERVAAYASGDLGYLVQLERIRFHVPGKGEESRREYRATMIFRREANGWRIVHRQADSRLTK